jgi:hypothetical protein
MDKVLTRVKREKAAREIRDEKLSEALKRYNAVHIVLLDGFKRKTEDLIMNANASVQANLSKALKSHSTEDWAEYHKALDHYEEIRRKVKEIEPQERASYEKDALEARETYREEVDKIEEEYNDAIRG